MRSIFHAYRARSCRRRLYAWPTRIEISAANRQCVISLVSWYREPSSTVHRSAVSLFVNALFFVSIQLPSDAALQLIPKYETSRLWTEFLPPSLPLSTCLLGMYRISPTENIVVNTYALEENRPISVSATLSLIKASATFQCDDCEE